MGNSAAKKKNNELKKSDFPFSDFVPYACHLDKNTLITKNAELMQVIKITGFNFEKEKSGEDGTKDLRSAIRKALLDNIKTNDFAIWFHTVRRKKSLVPEGVYKKGFSKELNDAWNKKNKWDDQYINELYISILIEGEPLKITDVRSFLRHILFLKEFRHRDKYFEKAEASLTKTTDSIIKSLADYGARKLGMYEDGGVYYSEILGFLGKIINLKEEPVPVDVIDASKQLSSHTLSFGFNVFEAKGSSGRHFGGIFTVKEYHEQSTKHIDELLQLPVKFVITETFDFVNDKKALEYFGEQYKVQKLSGDNEIIEASGLDEIMSCVTGSPTDFGEHQINVTIIEDSLPALDQEIEKVVDAFNNLGVVAVREDIFMEDCYWAQLPGNFEFIKRMAPINTSRLGGYASLYNFPAGKIGNNHWGPAVTVIKTAGNSPYFFNFHSGKCGHSMFCGAPKSGKTTVVNFLISEAMKFNPNVYIIDSNKGSEIFIKALGGFYQKSGENSALPFIAINPFQLDGTLENRNFLSSWLGCVAADDPSLLSPEDKQKISQAIEYTFSIKKEERVAEKILGKFWVLLEKAGADEADKTEEIALPSGLKELFSKVPDYPASSTSGRSSIEERFAAICGRGGSAAFFDGKSEGMPLFQHKIAGIDMSQLTEGGDLVAPVLMLILNKIEQSLDGKNPCIIVIDELLPVNNKGFLAFMLSLLEKLNNKNAIMLFSTTGVEKYEKSIAESVIGEKIKTKVFFPDKIESKMVFKNPARMLKEGTGMVADAEKRQFLLKHGLDSLIAEINLEGMVETNVLSSTPDNIRKMEAAITAKGENPDDWMPEFRKSFPV